MRSAKVNYLYNLAYQLLNVLMPLITAPYVARVIGATGIGISAYYNSLAGYFAAAGMLGLSNYGCREIARAQKDRDKMNKVFSGLFYLQLITCFLMIAAYIVYIIFFCKENMLLAWIYVLPIVAAMININWFFWGIEQFRITVTRSFAIKIITFFAILLFVRHSGDLWKYNIIMVLGIFLGNVPLLFLSRKYVSLVHVEGREIFQHLKPNLMLFVPIIGTMLYRSIDKIMLGNMLGFNEVGYYENADKIINICLGCITALGQVMMPRASQLISEGKKKESNLVAKKSFQFTTWFSSIILFGLLSVADMLVPLFFGQDFLASIDVLKVLSVSFLFLAWSNVVKTQIVMARKKDNIYIKSTLYGAGINIALNACMIPLFQGVGAAFATMITEGFVFFYITWQVRDEFQTSKVIKSSAQYLVIGAVMYVGVSLIGKHLSVSVSNLVLLVCSGGIIFLALNILLIVMGKDEFLSLAFGEVKNKLCKK